MAREAGGDTSLRQSSATEFLIKQEIPTSYIYVRLQRKCEDTCMDTSGVRWQVTYFKARKEHENEPRKSAPYWPAANCQREQKKFDELSEIIDTW
jgi:hypothetical protein